MSKMIYCMHCGQMMPAGHSAAHGVTPPNDPGMRQSLKDAIAAWLSVPHIQGADLLVDRDREQYYFGTELDAHRNLDGAEDVYDARRRRKDAGMLW